MLSENDPAKMLRICAEDPMWANHAEVSKSLLIRSANEIDRLRTALAQAEAAQPVAAEVESLRAALQWYADGQHFDRADPDAWDTVSGEPQNWWCDDAGTATVEDGSLARMVLDGKLTGQQLQELEDGEVVAAPQPAAQQTPSEKTP